MSPSLLLLLVPLTLITASLSAPSLPLQAQRQITCSAVGDCPTGNVCISSTFANCEPSDEICICNDVSGITCSSDDGCDGDLTCAELPDGPKVCIPKGLKEELEDATCIDAAALQHLQTHELVYSRHVSSRVLCDAFGSCATRGHIVRYAGKAMMMKNYCRIVACEERIIKVNSPRYSVGMRVPSKTDGLEYTSFAARYESVAEEAAMAAAVRMGL